MPNIDYLKIFRDAWKIIWKNRFLWWFGLFLIMPGILNLQYSPQRDNNSQENWPAAFEKIHLQEFLANHATPIAFALGILSVLFLVFLVIRLISRGALIKSTQRILKNEPADFRLGFKDGKKYFWKILTILFFSGLAIVFFIIVLAIPIIILFNAKSYIIGGILALIAIIILIPLLILCKYLQVYASFYIVLADLKPWLAVENAYMLFKKNILSSIIMSLLFIPLGIISFFVLIALFLTILIVFGLIGLVLFFILKDTGAIIAIVLGLLAFILAAILFYSIFSAFSEVSWVLFFHVIATPKEKEKIKEKVSEEKTVSALPTTEAMKTIKTETDK